MVPGLANHLRRAGDDLRKLFAEQHENNAVCGKLNRVPTALRRNPGEAERMAALFDVIHGDAGGDRGENAGTMQMLGQQVCAEGYQQADKNLRAGFFAEMLGYPVLRHRYNPGNADSKCDAANRDPQERAESIDERERPGQSRSDGKTHADQTRGVIEQGLAFKNAHQTLGDRYAGSDCGYGNRVRRRNDRGEREGDGDSGIIQLIKKPTPTTVNTTRPSASSRIVPLSRNRPSLGMRQPSRKRSGGRNNRKKISGFSATPRLATEAMIEPSAI